MAWISVRNWRKFQHYDPEKRQPPWIKVYTELMSDPAWLDLSGNDRSVLCCLWLEYASSRCRLRADTRSLTRQLNLRVTTATLERLNHAGYIDIVASAVLAEGYHAASAHARATEVEVETEEEKPPNPNPSTNNGAHALDDLPNFDTILKDIPA
jgi:hypothetical protein